MLSERELESRYEVFVEQYVVKLNIEAETTYSIAKTMLLPAAMRYLGELEPRRRVGRHQRRGRRGPRLRRHVRHARSARSRTRTRATRSADILDEAKYVQSTVVPAMAAVREIADKLERHIPDSLWPLPKYSEILFVK